MYEAYFNLAGAPFRLSPDPKFFFGSRSHNKAMAYLHYGLKQAEGFIVITGPVGAGKSIMIGHLLSQLDKSDVIAAHLQTSSLAPEALLGHILSAFDIEIAGEGSAAEKEALEDFLFDQLREGRRPLLIIDEAQNLPAQTLEELRMLSNMDYDGTPLFQVFLVGQPEFRDIIQSPSMEQLRQRVIASYHLEALSNEETREYILHRLSVVGWREDPVFLDEAMQAVFEETQGLPRRINTLCNRLMLFCALEKRHEITLSVVEEVINELREEELEAHHGDIETPSTPPPTLTQRQDQSAASEFDRILANRRVHVKAPPGADDRQEATLSDVASAIAAVTVEEAAADLSNDNAPLGQKSNRSDNPDRMLPTAAVIRVINETREELKEARAMSARLRKAEAQRARWRQERLTKAKAGLARADELLGQLRKGHR